MQENLQEKAEEYLNGWKRAQADLANYKKDETKRFEEIIKFSNESLIKDLLVVLDSLALAAEKEDNKGFYVIKSQLEEVFKKNGLEKIEITIGQQFDSSFHEVLAVIDSKDNKMESGAIVEEIGAGYKLNGKIICPAKVKVIK